MMSGNGMTVETWNRNVLSHWREVIDGDDWTWRGTMFQMTAAATGTDWQPMLVRRYDRTNSLSVDDNRRRRWPGRSNAGKSWFKYARPCHAAHNMTSAPVLNSLVLGDTASVISRGHWPCGHSAEVETPNKLQHWERPGGVVEDRQEDWQR